MAALYPNWDHSLNSWEPCSPVTLVNDTSLANVDAAAETSSDLNIRGASRIVLYVQVAVEAGQKVVIQPRSSFDPLTARYNAWDQDKASIGKEELVFDTNGNYAIGIDVYGEDWLTLDYGYRGGTGAGATLRVDVVGKRIA